MFRPVVLLALAAAPVAGQASFEGAVSMTITGNDGRTMPLNYLLRDGKMRFDMSGGRGGDQIGMVMDPAAKKVLIILAAQRMYMEQDLAAPDGFQKLAIPLMPRRPQARA